MRDARLRVHTNTTLCRPNLDEAESFPRFVRDVLGLPRFSMNLVIPTGSAARDPALAVRYTDIGTRIDAIRSASRAAGVEFLWYSPVPMCLYNTVAHGLGNKGCGACDGLLSIAPDGAVLPCSAWPEPVGHLLHDGFAAAWESAAARRHRAKAHAPDRCRSCEHLDVCHGACPLYWNRLGDAELDTVPAPTGAGGRS